MTDIAWIALGCFSAGMVAAYATIAVYVLMTPSEDPWHTHTDY